jgi:Protein of unknown function (DUF1490)
MVPAMAVYGLLAKAVGTVVTGLVGVTVYGVVRKAAAKAPLHQNAVSTAGLGLRGARKAERPRSRLGSSWPMSWAEARERIGEEAPTPSISDADDHEH